MKRVTALGAAALLTVGLYASATAVASATPIEKPGEAVCPEEGKVEVQGGQTSIIVEAPDGKVITGYCVKAGSSNSGAGVEYVKIEPPATTVEIAHESGKEISHYTVTYQDAPSPSPSPSEEPTPTPTPSEEPTPSPSPSWEPTPIPTPSEEPTPTPSEEPTPSPSPSEESSPTPVPTPSDESPTPSDKPEPTTPDEPNTPSSSELASTGPLEVLGYAMLAILLIGGGAAALVIARRRLS